MTPPSVPNSSGNRSVAATSIQNSLVLTGDNPHVILPDPASTDRSNILLAYLEGYQKLSNTGFCGSLSNCY